MPGLNQGPPPSDAPVVDTAEQVENNQNSYLYSFRVSLSFIPKGIYIVSGSPENAQARSCWSTYGGDGLDVGRICR